MINWLIKNCKESETFANVFTAVGILAIIFIAII